METPGTTGHRSRGFHMSSARSMYGQTKNAESVGTGLPDGPHRTGYGLAGSYVETNTITAIILKLQSAISSLAVSHFHGTFLLEEAFPFRALPLAEESSIVGKLLFFSLPPSSPFGKSTSLSSGRRVIRIASGTSALAMTMKQ